MDMLSLVCVVYVRPTSYSGLLLFAKNKLIQRQKSVADESLKMQLSSADVNIQTS